MRWHLMTEIEERGAEAVIADAIAEALDGPDAIYLSVDIDVVDPGSAPGTGTPEPGGMLPRELLRAVRQIVGAVELAGMDIVEVSPPYDWAESTAMIANRVRPRGDLRAGGQAPERRYRSLRPRSARAARGTPPGGVRSPVDRVGRQGDRAPVRPRPERRSGRRRAVPGAREADRRADPRARRRLVPHRDAAGRRRLPRRGVDIDQAMLARARARLAAAGRTIAGRVELIESDMTEAADNAPSRPQVRTSSRSSRSTRS